jgi:hypothetical protein
MSLREFWFPLLLTAAGLLPLFFVPSATGNGRRTMLTVTIVLFFLAALAFVWGDPVRGPFANLTRPRDATTFFLTAGVTCGYSVSQLRDGIDFSRCVSMPGQPIELWVRKTWWSGLDVRLRLKGTNGPILVFDNRKVQYSESAEIDVKYDDYAFEVVGPTKAPVFQFVIAKDYQAVYVNARMLLGNQVLTLKDRELSELPIEEAKQPRYSLDRIFKYPSYLHQGERD